MRAGQEDDVALVLAARAGDAQAFAALFDRWFDRCHDVARRIVRSDEAAADVAQDTFLAAWRGLGELRDPSAFGGWVLRTARNRALSHLERERRSVPSDPTEGVLANAGGDVDVEAHALAPGTAAAHDDILRGAAAALGEREASVLDLHLRHGLGAAELAEELGVTPNHAHQLLFRMRKNLATGVRSWVLWAGGDPACPTLRADLAGAPGFDQRTARAVDHHAEGCDECRRRRAAVLDPAALFAAVPLLVAAPGVRSQVARVLGLADPPSPTGELVGAAVATASDPPTGPGGGGAGGRRRAGLVVAAVAVVLLGLVGWMAVGGSDDGDDVAAGGPAPSSTSTTGPAADDPATSAPATSTTTPAATPSSRGGNLPATTAPEGAPTSTEPRGSEPVAPGTDPGYVPPPPGPPTSGASATTAPPPAAPRVDSFTATPLPSGPPCAPGALFPTRLAWTTTGATSVDLAWVGGQRTGLPADGSTVVCRQLVDPRPGGWDLTASGPGGSAGASA